MRIVALSDQHGYLPEIPPCDLLIIAGDVCPDRFGPFVAMHNPDQQKSWFDRNVRANSTDILESRARVPVTQGQERAT